MCNVLFVFSQSYVLCGCIISLISVALSVGCGDFPQCVGNFRYEYIDNIVVDVMLGFYTKITY